MSCSNCGSETRNPKFCSRSCAASFNNKRAPKRLRSKRCTCGALLLSRQRWCGPKCRPPKLADGRLCDIQRAAQYQVNAYVRMLARAACAAGPCESCGYSRHTEVCHVRAIKDFPATALVSEVNAPENLRRLCPNCHWELDNPAPGIEPEPEGVVA